LVAVVLVALVSAVFTGAAAWAAPVPSQSSTGSVDPVEKEAVAAERAIVTGALMDFGLTEEDADARAALLTDAEIHMLASDLDSMQVAGDNFQWDTTTVLLVLILVVLIVD
jgi:hypothetical protein